MATKAEEPMDVDSSAADLPLFSTVRILELVKDAQQQHGLRHGDYYRYRTYCKARLTRLRKTTNFQNSHKGKLRHKAKFVKKRLTDELFTDERLMQLSIFEAERSWATAMAAKLSIEDNPDNMRKKYTMRRNLKKYEEFEDLRKGFRAVIHAQSLEGLVRNSPRCDVPTKLEAQAYAAWLLGICCFELRQWNQAAEALKAARALYEGLADATPNTSLANLYKGKCREVQPQIRLCEFNSSDSSDASMSELMALRLQLGGGEGLDHLISEMRAKASNETTLIVEWAKERSTVEDDKIKQVIQGWNQVDSELKQVGNAKERMALYEKALMDTRDAIDKVNDLIRRKTSLNADASALRTIKSYLEFLKISGTAARYLTIIENSKVEKKAKPQDLLRLYDSVIENLKEVLEIPGVEADSDILNAYNGKIAFYRAFRCHHMAVAYAAQSKFGEASALFERALSRKKEADKSITGLKNNKYFKESAADLKELENLIANDRELARAKQLTEAGGLEDKDVVEGLDGKVTLMENLSTWCVSALEANFSKKKPIPVTRVPPALEPMPNKPLFFDLALNHIEMPMAELQARLEKANEGHKATTSSKKEQTSKATTAAEQQQQGISGMVKGWFWGKS